MGRAFYSDVWRTVVKSRKRFVSILVICALGVTMVTGLRASCVDLRQTADAFYDAQQLYDLKVQSTLGLTADDVAALSAVDGVERAEGAWEETTYTELGDARASVDVKALSETGMNQPVVHDGRLPERAGEVAVTSQYLKDSGAALGDVINLDAARDDAEVFELVPYTIVGVVTDPAEMTNPDGSIAIRAAASSDYFFFVTPDAVTSDVFTAIYVQVAGADGELCYSDGYAAKVDAVANRVEALRVEREQARTSQVRDEALDVIADKEAEADRQFADAQAQLDDAQAQIDDGWAEIERSRAELADGQAQIDDGAAQLDAQASQLADGQAQIQAAYDEIADGQALIAQKRDELAAAKAQIDAGLDQIADGQAQVEAGYAQARAQRDDAIAQADAALAAGHMAQDEHDAAIAQIEQGYAEGVAELDAQADRLAASKAELDARAAQVADGVAQLNDQADQLAAGKQQLDDQAAQLASGASQLDAARGALESSRAELADGRSQLASGIADLESGQSELDANRTDFEASRDEARQQFADARAEVDDIADARWYVQDRSSNTAYASVESDAGSIEAIGFVFPVVFIVVAVLIGLTAITRMVEEERGLIGTYKSLGYPNAAILSKYFVYALAACVIGGVVGELCGFVAFPSILFAVFEVMYSFDSYQLVFDAPYGIGSLVLFIAGIAGAAVVACRSELRQTPAALMRPKPPRSGSRIFLERIGFVWRRMTFLNKVTARNVFRYKKRFFMTVFGIAGCMALLVCGFAIRDTVTDLSAKQYGEINRCDLLVAVDESSFDELSADLRADGQVASAQGIAVDNVTLSANDDQEALQLYVVPDGAPISDYVNLRSAPGEPVALPDDGLLLTRNAAEMLGVGAGDEVRMKTSAMDEAAVPVSCVIDGYLGNACYLDENAYARLFDEAASDNAFYVNLADDVTDQAAVGQELAQVDGVRTVSSTQQMIDEFSQAFQLINTIVYVIIVLAAALAFVVLFTLSTTNISERVRELATIKVLGFRRGEVNRYVNKETILLTGVGILLGLPAGYAFSHSLTYVLKMPSIYFAVHIEPVSFVFAAALTLFFAFVVALLSNRALAKIDMIEALKSVE